MNKPRLKGTLLPFFLLFSILPCQAQDTEIIDALKSCARMDDATARSACYEALGTRVLNAEAGKVDVASPDPETTPTDVSTTSTPQQAAPTVGLPDSLGGGKFADDAGAKKESSRGLVTSCKKAADRSWFYIFDSGQVWKQVDRRKRRHKDCNFYVTITKDTFGYVMQIDGQDSTIRVDRRR